MPDPRKLKDVAAEAAAKGRYRRAAEVYEQIAKMEPGDPQWPHRAGEAWKRAGDRLAAVAQLSFAADNYARGGFFLKAISVAKMILEIDPSRTDTQDMLAALYAKRDRGPDNPVPRGTWPTPGQRQESPHPPPEPEAAPAPTAPRAAAPPPAAKAPAAPPAAKAPAAPPAAKAPAAPPAAKAPAAPPAARSPAAPPAPRAPAAPPASRAGPSPAPVPASAARPAPPAPARPATAAAPAKPGPNPTYITMNLDTSYMVPLDEALPPAAPPLPPVHVIEPEPESPFPDIPVTAAPPPSNSFDKPLNERVPGAHISQDFSVRAFEIPLGSTIPPFIPQGALALPHIPLFSSLDETRLRQLIEGARILLVRAGDAIVQQGERGASLYVVVRGGVLVRVAGVAEPVARLGEGEFFGELALLSDQPRLATVEAEGEVEVLEIGREVIWELIDESPDVLRILLRFFRERLIHRLIQTSPLFSPFSGPESQQLAERFQFLEFQRGAELLHEGQRAEGLFVILLGRCDVVTAASGPEGTLGPGELIGEVSLLMVRPAAATVIAATPVWALALPKASFQELILTHPQVLIYVHDVAEKRARDPGGLGIV